MPKKIMETREELRMAMIDTAERIIKNDGVAALTARKLAQELGIAVGTTYNIFRHMDDLVSEVSTRTLSNLTAKIVAVDGADDDPEATLMAYADAYITFVTSNPKRWDALFQGSMDAESEIQQRNTAQVNRLFEALEKAVAPLYEDGREAELAKSARALWAAVHGILSLTAGGRSEILGLGDVHEAVGLLVHYHVEGLKTQL